MRVRRNGKAKRIKANTCTSDTVTESCGWYRRKTCFQAAIGDEVNGSMELDDLRLHTAGELDLRAIRNEQGKL